MRGHADGCKPDVSKYRLDIRRFLIWKGQLWEQPSRRKWPTWPQDKLTKHGEKNEVVCLPLIADTELGETVLQSCALLPYSASDQRFKPMVHFYDQTSCPRKQGCYCDSAKSVTFPAQCHPSLHEKRDGKALTELQKKSALGVGVKLIKLYQTACKVSCFKPSRQLSIMQPFAHLDGMGRRIERM